MCWMWRKERVENKKNLNHTTMIKLGRFNPPFLFLFKVHVDTEISAGLNSGESKKEKDRKRGVGNLRGSEVGNPGKLAGFSCRKDNPLGHRTAWFIVMVMASWGKDRAYVIRVDSIVWLDTGQIAVVDKSEEGFDPCSTAQVLVDLIPLRERGDGVSPSTGLGRMITTDLTASFLARGPISVSAIDRIQARNRGNLLCGLVDWRGETWRAGRWTILPL